MLINIVRTLKIKANKNFINSFSMNNCIKTPTKTAKKIGNKVGRIPFFTNSLIFIITMVVIWGIFLYVSETQNNKEHEIKKKAAYYKK